MQYIIYYVIVFMISGIYILSLDKTGFFFLLKNSFYVSGDSKRKNLFQFSFVAKADVCGMTDYISFPSDRTFFGKIRISCFHHNH